MQPLFSLNNSIDMPKRPLSAYNLFFAEERQKILGSRQAETSKTDKKVGFAGLAKTVAAKWNAMDDEQKEPYIVKARVEKTRYTQLVSVWREEKAVNEKKIEIVSPRSGGSKQVESNVDPSFFPSCTSDTSHLGGNLLQFAPNLKPPNSDSSEMGFPPRMGGIRAFYLANEGPDPLFGNFKVVPVTDLPRIEISDFRVDSVNADPTPCPLVEPDTTLLLEPLPLPLDEKLSDESASFLHLKKRIGNDNGCWEILSRLANYDNKNTVSTL